jgi:hypothetical protein
METQEEWADDGKASAREASVARKGNSLRSMCVLHNNLGSLVHSLSHSLAGVFSRSQFLYSKESLVECGVGRGVWVWGKTKQIYKTPPPPTHSKCNRERSANKKKR